MKPRDISGQRFGRLVAICREPRRVNGRMRTFWACRCDCGQRHTVAVESLASGNTTSCGCFQREVTAAQFVTHGRSKTRLHRIWSGMITRCTNPNDNAFHNYGGRGISICAAWRNSFEAFARDVGEPPSARHSIDRWPDKDGNYEPGNVRWATPQEQGRNRRGLIEIDFQGRRMCLMEAAELAGLAYATVYSRIVKHGWPLEQALSVPAVVGQKVQL